MARTTSTHRRIVVRTHGGGPAATHRLRLAPSRAPEHQFRLGELIDRGDVEMIDDLTDEQWERFQRALDAC